MKSIFVKGGCMRMLCCANTIVSLISVLMRYPSSVLVKKRLKRIGDTSAAIFTGNTPFRAVSIASLSRSVAKICKENPPWGLIFSTTSLKIMANE